MRNPSRRNKNIGTSKQGHGQTNKMSIPYLYETYKDFYERLGKYEKTIRCVNGHEFCFIIEETRKASDHACSVEDIVTVLKELPPEDFGELRFIVLRQPKRKEEVLSPVWGRLIYSYAFESDYYPAIILEAVNYERKFKWKKNLSVDDQKELNLLKEDGHPIVDTGKYYESNYEREWVRNTQLYRTLLHEMGHYVQYFNQVGRYMETEEDEGILEERQRYYFQIPKVEKERFANDYAEKMRKLLEDRKIIPFERK